MTTGLQNDIDEINSIIEPLEQEFLGLDHFLNGYTGGTGPTGAPPISNITGTGATGLNEYLNDYILNLAKRLLGFYDRKETLEKKKNNYTTGFNEPQTQIVNDINTRFNNKFSRSLKLISTMSDSKKQEFFDIYTTVEDNFTKDCFITSFIKQFSKSTPKSNSAFI